MSKQVIAVVGSAMMDLTCYAKKLPESGQTLIGELFTTGFGGKGANQAVMAANCGADLYFVGKIGDDLFGDSIAANFNAVGINSKYISRTPVATGVAHIWVDGKGENRIVIIPGANHEIDAKIAAKAIANIEELKIVIAQCEIKEVVTVAAFKAAKQRGATTILNPAPYQKISEELLDLTDWLIPNESEFREFHPQHQLPTSDEIMRSFRPGKNSIVTLGSNGAAFISTQGVISKVSVPSVRAIDSTGAGDAFVGAFAFGIATGMNPIDAMKFGCAIATNTVTKKGAQSSYPNQAEIKTLS